MKRKVGGDKKKQREWNPKTLALLKENGADLSKPHKIVNVFYVFNMRALERFTTFLKQSGYEIDEVFDKLDSNSGKYWSLHAFVQMIPNIENLNSMTDKAIDLARQNNARYDGWYTQPEE